MLRGRQYQAELRYRDTEGELHSEKRATQSLGAREKGQTEPDAELGREPLPSRRAAKPVKIYPYGVARNRLQRAAQRMRVPINIVDQLGQSEVLVTTKSFYRKRPRLVADAERRGLPIYVLRANTVAQMEDCLNDIFGLDDDPLRRALEEAREAIRQVREGAPEVELAPQNAFIRRQQHELARAARLHSYSVEQEPYRRVRICQEE